MRIRVRRLAPIVLAVALAAAFAIVAFAQYNMTVNKDRLLNASNEPQNWLMMNGDYASTRYSKLSQINRDNVKNLRMVWALALGGMQDVGQNGPENELNPLVDNGFMYTTDGWGTVYKIDARDPNRGESLSSTTTWRCCACSRQRCERSCQPASSKPQAMASKVCSLLRMASTNNFRT